MNLFQRMDNVFALKSKSRTERAPRRYVPAPLRTPPRLREIRVSAPTPRYALLINPFYPKDPHASFGKHVLTPSLALTTVAGATPPGWRVRYWDENLLQGPPPCEPFPQVVGITVHLTFAQRASAAAELSHDQQPDRDARLSQSLRVLLSRHRRSAHAVSNARPAAGRQAVPGRRTTVWCVHRQQPRLKAGVPARALPRAAA